MRESTVQVPLPAYAALALSPQQSGMGRDPAAAEQSLKRVYLLIGEALKGVTHPEWRVDGAPELRSPISDEPYGLERFPGGFCVYTEERGQRFMLAVFARATLAADYFVGMVSAGQRQIDWRRHLDMER